MKNSIRDISAIFSTSRMVAEYTERFYLPSARRWKDFNANQMERAREMADWKESLSDRWSEVAVGKVDVVSRKDLHVGSDMQVRCQVKLGSIDPSDVVVELYQGPVDSDGNIQNGTAVPMEYVGAAKEEHCSIFNGLIPCQHTGLCGFAVRVMPSNPFLSNKYETGLIRWEEASSQADLRKNKAVQEAT